MNLPRKTIGGGIATVLIIGLAGAAAFSVGSRQRRESNAGAQVAASERIETKVFAGQDGHRH